MTKQNVIELRLPGVVVALTLMLLLTQCRIPLREESAPQPSAETVVPPPGVCAAVEGMAEGSPAWQALEFLRREGPSRGLATPCESLSLSETLESPAGHHIRFQYLYGGLPVRRVIVQVNLTRDGKLLSTAGLPPQLVHIPSAVPMITRDAAVQAALAALPSGVVLRQDEPVARWIVPQDGNDVLAWRVPVKQQDAPASWLVYIDALKGNVIDVESEVIYTK